MAMKTPIPFSEPPYLAGLPSPYYNPSHLRWQKACRAFIEENLLKHAMKWEKEETVPDGVFKKFAAANMLVPSLPAPLPVKWLKRLGVHEMLGGVKVEDWDYIHTAIYTDEMARSGLAGPSGSLTTGIAFGVPPILKFGSDQLQERFLPDLLLGKKRICIAITEPGAGSDVANIQTTAVKTDDGKHYIVNGTKKWITNGVWSEYSSMAVRTGGSGPGGLSMLLVPLKGYPGVSMRRLKVAGQISAGTTFIELDDVKIPVENLIGEEGMGMRYIMTNFNHERLTIAIGVTRQARVALSAAFEYCLRREAFGKTLMDQPVVRHRLAKCGAELESQWAWVEQFVYQMTKLSKTQADVELGGLTALAKAQAGRVLDECARCAVLLFGGNGFTRSGQGELAEMIYREVPGARIPGGSEDVMMDLAVRQLVKNYKNKTKMLERPRGDSELRAPTPYGDDRVQLCTDLRPTECCQAIAGTLEYFKILTLKNLPPGAISAAFRQSGNAKGCDGKTLQINFGSGEFSFQSRGTKITGGSYIVCSARPGPPIGRIAFLNSRCPAKRSVEEDVQMEERAERGYRGVSSYVYADVVEINGTKYCEDPKGSLVYKDKDGGVLDMNLLKY